MSLEELQATCEEAVRLGGGTLRGMWAGPLTLRQKGATDLVTDADKASEQVILRLIESRSPGDLIISEESVPAPKANGSSRVWYVDPLDGTVNFAHGLPQFCVTVAVADQDGMAAGATYAPLSDELFSASRGGGAKLNGQRIVVSNPSRLSEALLVTGFAADLESYDAPLSIFRAVLMQARGLRRMGAGALDLAYVAAGRFDGFWEGRFRPWDMAAGILLVREAGGVVQDFAGGLQMLERAEIIASAPGISSELLTLIRAGSCPTPSNMASPRE